MSSTYGQTWADSLRLAFNGSKGGKILKGLAALLIDKTLDWGTAGLAIRFPIQADGTPAEATALSLMASERRLILDPAASTATQAANIAAAQIAWRYAGTPLGMCLGIYLAGLYTPLVVTQNGLQFQITGTPNFPDLVGNPPVGGISWFTITTLPNGNPALPASTDGRPAVSALTVPWWMFDAGMDAAGNQYCSRFALVYYPGAGTIPNFANAEILTRAQRVIAGWKPAHARCMGIWNSGSGTFWWNKPATLWGTGGIVWGGVSTVYAGDV